MTKERRHCKNPITLGDRVLVLKLFQDRFWESFFLTRNKYAPILPNRNLSTDRAIKTCKSIGMTSGIFGRGLHISYFSKPLKETDGITVICENRQISPIRILMLFAHNSITSSAL
jgi:hypothetical protein